MLLHLNRGIDGGMDIATQKNATISDWLAFAAANPDSRTELIDGEIVTMAPETATHSRVKVLVTVAFELGVREQGLACTVYVDGIGVGVTDRNAFIPDVLLQCGRPVDGSTLLADAPTVVVEVLSPSNTTREMTRKLLGYFRNESLAHYLVIDPADRSVDHHRRDRSGALEVSTLSDGVLMLEPPGLELEVARFFP